MYISLKVIKIIHVNHIILNFVMSQTYHNQNFQSTVKQKNEYLEQLKQENNKLKKKKKT